MMGPGFSTVRSSIRGMPSHFREGRYPRRSRLSSNRWMSIWRCVRSGVANLIVPTQDGLRFASRPEYTGRR